MRYNHQASISYRNSKRSKTMKEYKCVEVTHHKDVGEVIAEYQNDGWTLHTYQATGLG